MERKDDAPSVSAAPGYATHRRHRRGMLALLPDTLQHFPYNYTVWKEGYLDKRAQLLSRTKRQRRRRLYNNSNTETQSSSAHDDDDDVNQETSTDQVLEQATAAALLLVDPYQPYSLQVLDRLIQRLVLPENNHLNHHQQQQQEQQHVHGIILLLLNTSGDDDNVWRIQIEDLLSHTGLSLLSITPQQSSSSSSWWPWFQTTLNLYTCPALCVLETRTGRRISVTAEEMALEWNNNNAAAATEISTTTTASCEETTTTTTTTTITSKKDPVLRAWCQGRSALSWSQQARAALTVPSAMPCVLS